VPWKTLAYHRLFDSRIVSENRGKLPWIKANHLTSYEVCITISASVKPGKNTKDRESVRPGETLRSEFLEPLEMSANALAIELRAPANRIQGILTGKRGITADTALRLAQYFGNTPEFWMNLQQNYELEQARRGIFGEIEKIPRRPPGQEVRKQQELKWRGR
jgi:antitoxin HigA-1